MSSEPSDQPVAAPEDLKKELEQIEARERIEKLRLEQQKLQLESRTLTRQLSLRGQALEWLKAGTVLAAFIAAGVAYFVGHEQTERYETNRRSDQFDKALTRLASSSPGERLTGVAGLRLFLLTEGGALHRESLHSLINAISYEREERVGTAIRNVFANLKKGQVRQEILDEALKFALELNRSVTNQIVTNWSTEAQRNQKRILVEAGVAEADTANILLQIPSRLLRKLKPDQYLKYLAQSKGPFDDLGNDVSVPLNGLRDAVISMVALGATAQDFSAIYCQWCDFTPAKRLAGASFSEAYLSGANFSGVDLQGTSFTAALLMGTKFYGADLRGADLTQVGQLVVPDFYENMNFPLLACARLEGANLTGLVLLSIMKTYDMNGDKRIEFVGPDLQSARIDASTRLDNFNIMLTNSLSDAYIDTHGDDDVVSRFATRDLQKGEDLFGESWNSTVRRNSSYLYERQDIPANSIFIAIKNVDDQSLAGYGREETALLRTYLLLPSLRSLPLIKKIDELKAEALPSSVQQPVPWDTPKADDCTPKPEADMPPLVLRREVPLTSGAERKESSAAPPAP